MTSIPTIEQESSLDAAIPFTDYEDQLIVGPGRTPNLRWCLGKDAFGGLVWDSWSGGPPSLFIVGPSSSGKTTLMESMMLQLASNNTPDQVQFHLVESQFGLESYRNLSHVDRLLWIGDNDPPPPVVPDYMAGDKIDSLQGRLLQLLVDNVDEAYRRIATFGSTSEGTATISTASEAWRIGLDCDISELRVPRRIVIIDETLAAFDRQGTSTSAVIRSNAALLHSTAERLAAVGPSVGIHLCMLAHRGRSSDLPRLTKPQSRILGFRARDKDSSLANIGLTGLEGLPYGIGHGLWLDGTGPDAIRMRSLYLDPSHSERILADIGTAEGRTWDNPIYETEAKS